MVFCLPHRLSLELSPTTRQNSRPESCTGSGQFPAQGLVSAVLLAEKALPPHPSYHTGLISLSLIETSPHSSPLSQPPSLLSLFALVFFLLFANTFCETLSSTHREWIKVQQMNQSFIHSIVPSLPSFPESPCTCQILRIKRQLWYDPYPHRQSSHSSSIPGWEAHSHTRTRAAVTQCGKGWDRRGFVCLRVTRMTWIGLGDEWPSAHSFHSSRLKKISKELGNW